jgi:hypothetical protein
MIWLARTSIAVSTLALLGTSGCCCGFLDSASAPTPAPSARPVVGPPPPPTVAPYDPQFIATHLTRARTESGCDAVPTGPTAIFCPALRGWDTGIAAPLPPGPIPLIGVTTWIPTATPFAAADARQRRLSFLVLRSDPTGRYGTLITPRGDNAGEDLAVAQTLSIVAAAVPTGSTAPIAVPMGLHSFANAQAQSASYPIASTGQGWQLQGGSFADVRRVGNVWVSVEVPRNAPAGLYFSVFVDSPLTPR